MDNQLQLEIGKLSDELKKIVRRQIEMQKSLDLLFADREILEDIIGSVKHLQEIIIHSENHVDNVSKSLKQEVVETQAIVENKVTEIQDKISDNTIVIKTNKDNLFKKLRSLIFKDRKAGEK